MPCKIRCIVARNRHSTIQIQPSAKFLVSYHTLNPNQHSQPEVSGCTCWTTQHHPCKSEDDAGFGGSSHLLVCRRQWRSSQGEVFRPRSECFKEEMRMKERGVLFTSWQSSFEHPLEDNEKTTIFMGPVYAPTALIYLSCCNVYAMGMCLSTLPS
jgi:hypothetical protein